MDRLGDVTRRVNNTLTLELLDVDGSSAPLVTDLIYDADDPYAVTAAFRSGDQAVCWTFGRYLLLDGMHAPAGEGDVHVWPCLDASGTTVVMIELESPDGEVLVRAPMSELSAFVSRTVTMVPPGTETEHLDIDEALRRIFTC